MGGVGIERQVAELVDNHERGLGVGSPGFLFQAAVGVGVDQAGQQRLSGYEQHRVALADGFVAQRDRQVRFADARWTQQRASPCTTRRQAANSRIWLRPSEGWPAGATQRPQIVPKSETRLGGLYDKIIWLDARDWYGGTIATYHGLFLPIVTVSSRQVDTGGL